MDIDEQQMSHCRKRLRARGLRPTEARLAVYETLCDVRDHPTADDLFARVRQHQPGIALGTVYNSLGALKRSGMVGTVDGVPGAARYDARRDPHHHLVCRGCGRIADIQQESLDQLDLEDADGFEVERHTVAFFGLCPECQKENFT